jgi:hypothetical protein
MKRFFSLLFFIILLWGIHFGQTMSTPINVSNSPTDASQWGQVAFGSDGKIHIVWEEDYKYSPGSDIFYMSYDGQDWNGPVNLKKSKHLDASRPDICTSKTGGVFVVWSQENWFYFVEYDPQGKKWSSPFKVGREAHAARVAADDDGNVYIIWYSRSDNKSYSRSRINNQWEDQVRLSASGRRSEHVAITAGDDGRIWAIWLEKVQGPYRIYYNTRKKNTQWSSRTIMTTRGHSAFHPDIDVGPDNVPVVAFINETAGSPTGEVWVCTINEANNPTQKVAGDSLQHHAKIAVDSEGYLHVAWQIGPGSSGRGVKYRNNVGGEWNQTRVMPYSRGDPKKPGIAADEGGNVVLCWSSSVTGSNKEIWLSSLYPILVLHPPINLNMNISINSLKETPQIIYDLSWEPNPENEGGRVKGYNLYKKENGGPWELLLSLNKNTFSASFTFTGSEQRITLGIRPVSVNDTEGPIAIFGID